LHRKTHIEIDEYISEEDKKPQLSDENSFSDWAEGNEISSLRRRLFFEDVDNSKAEKANKGSGPPIHTQTAPQKNLIKEKTTSFQITFTVYCLSCFTMRGRRGCFSCSPTLTPSLIISISAN